VHCKEGLRTAFLEGLSSLFPAASQRSLKEKGKWLTMSWVSQGTPGHNSDYPAAARDHDGSMVVCTQPTEF